MRRQLMIVTAVAALAICTAPGVAGATLIGGGARASASVSATTPSPQQAKAELIGLLSSTACPVLGQQAAPAFQALVTSQCEAIIASPNPINAATAFLPLLCVGTPSFGDLVFPQYAPLFDAACPLVNQLPPLPQLPTLPLLGGLL